VPKGTNPFFAVVRPTGRTRLEVHVLYRPPFAPCDRFTGSACLRVAVDSQPRIC